VVRLNEIVIAIKGAGEMASAVAWRLYMAKFTKILMMETASPLAVRREVSFCDAVRDGKKSVEEVNAVLIKRPDEIKKCWENQEIGVVVDPQWRTLETMRFEVLVDAILAKKNLGTKLDEASLVIGLGPGFVAGRDVHLVIETNRGHNLGRIITSGEAESNTGTPGAIGGFAEERVLRAPTDGEFQPRRDIGDYVKKDEIVGSVAGVDVPSPIEGVIRGLIRSGCRVFQGLKIGDIDPRGQVSYCYSISDKARAIGGSVLEAVLRAYNL
jgi:xanthine dehydrogenase accessory factor